MTYDPRRMQLVIADDGFTIDTQRGMKVHINNERVIFTGDSTSDLSLPVDKVVELIDNLNLAYKLLVHSRTGDIHFHDQPNLQQSRVTRVPK